MTTPTQLPIAARVALCAQIAAQIEAKATEIRHPDHWARGDWNTLAVEGSAMASRSLLYTTINRQMLIDAAAHLIVAAERCGEGGA